MLAFIDRLFGRNTPENKGQSSKLAKDRLQFVLVQDRIDMTSDKLQAMKQEIIEVISKYVSVDLENVDFALTNRERSGLLIAEIPFTPVEDTADDNATASEENESSETTAESTPAEAGIAEQETDAADTETPTIQDPDDTVPIDEANETVNKPEEDDTDEEKPKNE